MSRTKLDSAETIFFARELEHIKRKTYDRKYARIRTRELIPVSFEAGAGTETITYFSYDAVGMAKIISNYARDFPRVDVKKEEFTQKVRSLGSSYGYSIQDIRKARQAGVSLEEKRANAAKRAIAEKEQSLAFFGSTAAGITGFFNNPNIPRVVLQNDGVGSGTSFASKIDSPDKIVRDLNQICDAPIENSNGTHGADTLLLPIKQKTMIASTPRSNNSDMTIEKYFLENHSTVKEVAWVAQLDASKSEGNLEGDTALAYERDPDNLELEVPVDFEQFPPEPKAMEFEVACHMRFGGVKIYYPLSMSASDDI